MLVAQHSQKDPKEYIPFVTKLQSLRNQHYMRYSIDLHLKDYSSALQNLHKAIQDPTVKVSIPSPPPRVALVNAARCVVGGGFNCVVRAAAVAASSAAIAAVDSNSSICSIDIECGFGFGNQRGQGDKGGQSGG